MFNVLSLLGAGGLVFTSGGMGLSTQVTLPPRPTIPAIFEPPPPRTAQATLLENCQETQLSVSVRSPAPARVSDLRFGAQRASAADYAQLDHWLANLNGIVGVRAMCDRSGALLVFSEDFNSSAQSRRWVEVSYIGGTLVLRGMN